MTPYKGKGKAPMRDDDDQDLQRDDDQDSRGRQMSRPSSRQPSAPHYQMYPDHPPVLPSSINIRDFAYEGPAEQQEIPHIWAPELVAQAYLATTLDGSAEDGQTAVARAAMNEAFDDEAPLDPTAMGRTPYTGSFDPQESSTASWGWDSEHIPERPTVTFTAGRAQDHAVDEDRAPSPATSPPVSNAAPVDPVQDEAVDQDRAPSPATSAPTRELVPLDPYEFPFDSLPSDPPNRPEDVATPSRCSNQEDDRAGRDHVVPSTGRVLRYMSSLWNRSDRLVLDHELSPRSRPVDGTAGASARIPEGVVRPSPISRTTQSAVSVDGEPSPRTQPTPNPLDNVNSWIPEGVAGPSTIIRPPTPQREPQRYSDIDTLMQSRNDSGQGEEANVDDAATQQVILRSLQTTAIVVNPAATEGEYGSDALENYTLPSSSSDDSSDSSEGLMMPPYRRSAAAPYQALRRRLSATPTPYVSPHLSPRPSPHQPSSPDTGGSPAQGGDVRLRSLARLRSPSPDLPRTQALTAEQRALERLRIYASMEDPTAQELLTAYERRLVDWQYGNTIEIHGIFLTRRADSTRLPHGYMPRFARWALELVESERATWDLFLLSVDDNRHFVLPHSTHAPEVSERPVLVNHLRTTSVPPTSRNHADVEVPERARSTSPEFTQVEGQVDATVPEEQSTLQPHIQTPSPNLAAAFMSTQRTNVCDPAPPIETPSPTLATAFMATQNTEQPPTQPADRELENGQVSSGRDTRDSVVSTSAGTERAQSTSYLLTLIEDPPVSVPVEQQSDLRPPTEVQLFLRVVTNMWRQSTPRPPAAQPAGQELESGQVGSSRDARDSIVRTSVGTGEKIDRPEVIDEEREEAAA